MFLNKIAFTNNDDTLSDYTDYENLFYDVVMILGFILGVLMFIFGFGIFYVPIIKYCWFNMDIPTYYQMYNETDSFWHKVWQYLTSWSNPEYAIEYMKYTTTWKVIYWLTILPFHIAAVLSVFLVICAMIEITVWTYFFAPIIAITIGPVISNVMNYVKRNHDE